jgi:hypothetical protein
MSQKKSNKSNNDKSDNYTRPKQTYTDKLDEDDIASKLVDYVKVENIAEIKLNTHLRYFTLEPNKKTGTVKRKFRMGGFLSNKNNADKYVILTNGKTTWSVQVANTVFYRKMSMDEVKEEYEEELNNMKKINKKLLKQNEKLKIYLKKKGIDYKEILNVP